MDIRNDENRESTGKETAAHKFPRSWLYNLVPMGMDTPWIESLTSYINRLAWAYRVGTRLLVAQKVVPHLGKYYHFQSSSSLLGAFCRSAAMSINSAGEVALDWSGTLARLTMRGDLQGLTLCPWAGKIPPQGLLRAAPAWCPTCYYEWREKGLPIYQPLIWMLQIVTVCLRHRRQLEERCPHCQQKQSVIPARIQPGCCTQCMTWLGISPDTETENKVDEGTLDW